MLIALIVIIGLSVLILGHEAGHFFVAKAFKLKVDEFGFGFPPRMFAWKRGETEYSLNWVPFGGFVKIAGENDPAPFIKGEGQAREGEPEKSQEEIAALRKRLFLFQSAPVRSLIVLAGVITNFFIGWFLLTTVLLVGTPPAIVITGIQPDSPAEQAGLMTRDVVKNYSNRESFIDFINQNKGKSITFDVLRGSKDIEITAVPRVETDSNQGALGVFLAEAVTERQGLFGAVWGGLKNSITICGMTLVAFYYLFKELLLHGSLLEGVVGPVGIFSVAQGTGSIGWAYLIQLLGIISLNLTIVNLIPFPALDGGRFFMILFEKIKGSPIPRNIEAIVNVVGFVFLILLMVLLTFRDVWNLL